MNKFIKLGIVSAAALVTLSGCGNKGGDTSATSAPSSTTEVPQVIDVESVALNKTSLDLYLNDSEFLRATVLPENASVKTLNWTSSNDEVAMVAANGKVIALAVGTAKIRCESVSNPQKFAECTVNVTKKDTTVHVQNITLDKTEAALYVNESLQLNASILPENATDKGIVWTSTNESVAYVSSDGKVYASAAGSAVVRAASHEYPNIYKECALTIVKKDTTVHVESVDIEESSLELDLGGLKSKQLVATVLPANATNKALSWSSSDPLKVTVDSANGTVSAIAESAEAVIVTARSVQDPEQYDTISITVKDTRDPAIHVDSISLQSTETLDLKTSPSKVLIPTFSPSNAWNKNVSWASDNSSIVSVTNSGDSNGVITGHQVGSAIITATTEDGSKTASCTVTVSDSTVHVESVIIKKDGLAVDDADITLNSFISLSAVATSSKGEPDNKNINWEYVGDAASYVQISSLTSADIMVNGKAATLLPIKLRAVSAENNTIYKEVELTVTDPTIYATGMSIKVNDVESSAASVELGKSITLKGAVLPLDATNRGISWSIFTSGGSSFISLGGDEGETITVLGKQLSAGVVVRATAKSDSNVYKDITIAVIDPTDVTRFANFVMPASIALYESATDPTNLNGVSGLDTASGLDMQYFNYDAEPEKKDNLNYKVGDQGIFTYSPSGRVKLPGASDYSTVTNPSTIKTLYLYNDVESKFEQVEINDYCTIAENGIDYTFKAAAVGGHFRLDLTPDPAQYYAPGFEPFEFEFDVVHGYNVDSLAELSLFDNAQSEWSDYKTASGLSGVAAEGGLVLHKNINIIGNILPTSFIWTEAEVDAYIASNPSDFSTWWNMVGFGVYGADAAAEARKAFINSPKDYTSLFRRLASTDAFDFYGNFFTLDCSQLSQICYFNYHAESPEDTMVIGQNGDGSHAQLFKVGPNVGDHEVPPASEPVSYNNLTISGNSQSKIDYPQFIKDISDPTERAAKEVQWDTFVINRGKGGYTIIQNDRSSTHVNNVIVHDSFIPFFDMNITQTPGFGMTVDRSIGYDSYSDAFYLWSGINNVVTNSWFARSGGPLALLDEAGVQNDKRKATISFENCYLDNPVTGDESWFAMHPGSAGLVQGYMVAPGLPIDDPSDPTECTSKWIRALSMQSQLAGSEGKSTSRINENSVGECNFIGLAMCVGDFGGGGYTNQTPQKSVMTVNNGNGSLSCDMSRLAMDSTTKVANILTEYGVSAPNPCIIEASGIKNASGTYEHGLSYAGGIASGYEAKAFSGNYMTMFLNVDTTFTNGLQYFGVMLKTY